MQNNLFTIMVTLVDGSHHNFPNMKEADVNHFKQVVWMQGVIIKKDNITRELVSPYRVSEVLIIQQNGKVPHDKG
jgi:hypothetical protein